MLQADSDKHFKLVFTILISQNACFMILQLRFVHLLDKALGLLLQTDITKKFAIIRAQFLTYN